MKLFILVGGFVLGIGFMSPDLHAAQGVCNPEIDTTRDEFAEIAWEIHRDNQCYLNVVGTATHLASSARPLARMNVLYLFHPDGSDIRAWPVRFYRSTVAWNYHVVLELDGVIYDTAYQDDPRPICTADYFRSFFFFDGRPLLVRTIPYNLYLKYVFAEPTSLDHRTPTFSWTDLRKTTGIDFPAQSIAQYLGLLE